MLAKDLAKAIEKHKGIVFVTAHWDTLTYIQAVKKDLISFFKRRGNAETGLLLEVYSDRAYIGADFELMHEQVEQELKERKE